MLNWLSCFGLDSGVTSKSNAGNSHAAKTTGWSYANFSASNSADCPKKTVPRDVVNARDSRGLGYEVSIRPAPSPEPRYQPLNNRTPLPGVSSFRQGSPGSVEGRRRFGVTDGGMIPAATGTIAGCRSLIHGLKRNCTLQRIGQVLGTRDKSGEIAEYAPKETLAILWHLIKNVIYIPGDSPAMASLFDRVREIMATLPTEWAISNDHFSCYDITEQLCLKQAVAGRKAIQPAGEVWLAVSRRLLINLPDNLLYEKFADILMAIQPLWNEYQGVIMERIIHLSGRMPIDQAVEKNRLFNSIMHRNDVFSFGQFFVLKALAENRSRRKGKKDTTVDERIYKRTLKPADKNEESCIIQIMNNKPRDK